MRKKTQFPSDINMTTKICFKSKESYMNRKINLLYVGEFSGLNTGYSRISSNLLLKFHETGRFNITELACYGKDSDPYHQHLKRGFPWKIIGNLPNNEQEEHIYNGHPSNEFGKWKFDYTCLESQPDVVLSCRDSWMDSHLDQSIFRRFYKLVMMPTVDALGQSAEWIDFYRRADGILTYTSFAERTLRDEGGGLIPLRGVATPAVDISVFKPVLNKKQHKAQFGLPPDSVIVGFVARNQKRKMYPDLAEAFAKFLEKSEYLQTENTYLYFHCCHPDVGWNIPEYIKKYGLSRKVLMTYLCHNCRRWFPAFYSDATTLCVHCGQKSACLSNSNIGIEDKDLACVYNFLDLYVQFATCFAKGTQVSSINGFKNIEDINIGDMVLTHKNRYRKVVNTFKNLSNSPIKEISFCSIIDKIVVTDNHTFPAWTKNEFPGNRSVKEEIGKLFNKNKILPNFGDYKVKELKQGDVLLCPINQTVFDIENIDISEFFQNRKYIVSDTEFALDCNPIHPRYIKVDKDFCRFIGLFVADGTISRPGAIDVTCHILENDNINLCKKVLQRLTHKNVIELSQVKYNRQAIDIIISSKTIHSIFSGWFSKGINKKLPDWVMQLPIEKQKEVIIGMCMGDGCYIPDKNITSYTTISKTLCYQLITLLRRLKIDFNVSEKIRPENRKNQYKFEMFGNFKIGDFTQTRHNTRNFYYKDYHCIQIKDIKDSKCIEDVYNIEVEEDHSYVVSNCGISTYNCEGLGIPTLEAAACNIPLVINNYSGMEDLVTNLEGKGLVPRTMWHEAETGRIMSYPSIEELVDYINYFISLPESIRLRMGIKTGDLCRQHYGSWEAVAKRWIDVFDSLSIGENNPWLSPIDFVPVDGLQCPGPDRMSDEMFISWMLGEVLHRPDWINAHIGLRLLRDLQWGRTVTNSLGFAANDMSQLGVKPAFAPCNRDTIFQWVLGLRRQFNDSEMTRKAYIDQGKIK